MVAPSCDLVHHLWDSHVPTWLMICTLEQPQKVVVTFHLSILWLICLWTGLGLELELNV